MSLNDAAYVAKITERNSDFGELVGAYEKTQPRLSTISSHPDLFNALLRRAFDGRVRFEPFFTPYGIIATEALATFETGKHQIPTQKVANQSYDLGLAVEFDTATAANALKQAEALPTTINVSVESALSEKFWKKMLPHLNLYQPKDIIFEILEHPVSRKACIDHLIKLHEDGYSFALDDFDIGKNHEDRLATFGPVIDIVKIDGSLVRGCLESKNGKSSKTLMALTGHIRHELSPYNPNVIILAEHVDNFREAQDLFDLGIDAVQGRNLKVEDYFTKIAPKFHSPVHLDIDLSTPTVDLEI